MGTIPPVYRLLSSMATGSRFVLAMRRREIIPCLSWTKHAQTPTPENRSLSRPEGPLLLLQPADVECFP